MPDLQPTEPLLAPPTLKEAIEQVLTAARWADSPTQRASLLGAALTGIERMKRDAEAEKYLLANARSI